MISRTKTGIWVNMLLSRLAVSVSGRHIAVLAFILLLVCTAVDSLVPPFSPRQFPSSLSVESPISSCTLINSFYSTAASSQCRKISKPSISTTTSLFATSLDSAKLDEDDTKEIDADHAQNELLPSVSKFRQLKDVMWIRETLEDLTAAEFALSVEQQTDGASLVDGNDATSTDSGKKKKRAVDYEKLLSQLTKRLEEVTCQPFKDYEPFVDDDGALRLDENLGMGRYAYTNEERTILMKYVWIVKKCFASPIFL